MVAAEGPISWSPEFARESWARVSRAELTRAIVIGPQYRKRPQAGSVNRTPSDAPSLPESGVVYYEVPPEYNATSTYRNAVVNNRVVLVDQPTRRIVQVIG